MDFGKIDKNFVPKGFEGLGEIDWYDIHTAPIKLYGFYDEEKLLRMDGETAEKTSEGVKALYKCTAGGRARLSTDSPFIAVSAELTEICKGTTLSYIGDSGFDLYLTDTNAFLGAFAPIAPYDNVNASLDFERFTERKINDFTIEFPTYNGVKKMYIGLKRGSKLAGGREYDSRKIVYYGSSITQGACASRAGSCYQNIIARKNNIDYINLGFSGNAKGEKIMAEYIARLHPDVFVLDYDYNADNAQFLKETHYPFYEAVRKENPDIPIIFISMPEYFEGQNDIRREIIYNNYLAAKAKGENVFFISGKEMIGENADDCTVDGVHPNDIGFARMADVIGRVINEVLK